MCGPKPDELIGWEASMLMTGKEYLDSIRGGRRVYIGGEVVEDVTAHPAFRNAARSFAMIYDRKRDPENRDFMTSRRMEKPSRHISCCRERARICTDGSRPTVELPHGRTACSVVRPITSRVM